ncbi:hypothetical protein HKX48_006318 [Thoreauomyces humboldtii]|nr:hypothetical protein HKX48_006318 [Thoreauomyces humboldtii]
MDPTTSHGDLSAHVIRTAQLDRADQQYPPASPSTSLRREESKGLLAKGNHVHAPSPLLKECQPSVSQIHIDGRRTFSQNVLDRVGERIHDIHPGHWRSAFFLAQLFTLGWQVCIAGLILGNYGVEFPLEPDYILSIAGLVVGLCVQIALFAPLELCRRVCQILIARRLTRGGMDQRQFLTTWTAISSLGYRGVEDVHLGQGFVTNLLLILYFAESIAIGSIGSLYYQVPVPFERARGHMPAYGPVQAQIYSSSDADGAIALAQDASLGFSRLYDPVVYSGMLLPEQELCPSTTWIAATATTPARNGTTSCSGIIASSLTLPDLTNGQGSTDDSDLDWSSVAAGDVFEGIFSTVGINATCSSLTDLGVVGSIQALTSINETTNLVLQFPNGDVIGGFNSMYAARESGYTTPTVQLEAVGWGDLFIDPYVSPSGGFYTAVMAFHFERDFSDMTTLAVPLQDDPTSFQNISVALCELHVVLGRAKATVEVTSVTPSVVSTLRSATYIDRPEIFDLRNTTSGYRNGTSGYGTAQFLWESLMTMSCDILPCAFNSDTPAGFALASGLVTRTSSPPGWEVDLDHQLATFTRAVSKLSTLFLSAYLAVHPIYDTDPTSTTTATTSLLRVAVYTNLACRVVLKLGIACACVLILMHASSLSPARLSVSFLNPSSLWLTDSIHSLLWFMRQIPEDVDPPDPDVDVVVEESAAVARSLRPKEPPPPPTGGSDPIALREAASRRIMVGSVDETTGEFRLTARRKREAGRSEA